MNYFYGAVAVLAALVALVFGLNTWEKHIEQRGYDKAAALYAEAALKDEQVQRTESERRFTAQQGIENEARQSERDAVGNNERLAAVVRGMRERELTARSKRPASNDPAVNAERAATDAYADTFADCRDKYREMGFIAQTARNAGLSCEKQYENLRPTVRQQVMELRGQK